MIHYRYILVILLFFCSLHSKAQSVDLFSYGNVKKYADYLYSSRQYKQAAQEYQRLMWLLPADTISELNLIRSYRYLDDFASARNQIYQYFPVATDSIPEAFLKELIFMDLIEKKTNNLSNLLSGNCRLNPTDKFNFKTGTLLLKNQWQEASLLLNSPDYPELENRRFQALQILAEKGKQFRPKSPVMAAIMSAILPGSGKLYTHNWGDAFYAMAVVGISSWLTYYSLDNGKIRFDTVLFGSMTAAFYAANIYGSYKSAIVKNQAFTNDIHSELKQLLIDNQ